jgi:hypothetical protein
MNQESEKKKGKKKTPPRQKKKEVQVGHLHSKSEWYQSVF